MRMLLSGADSTRVDQRVAPVQGQGSATTCACCGTGSWTAGSDRRAGSLPMYVLVRFPANIGRFILARECAESICERAAQDGQDH